VLAAPAVNSPALQYYPVEDRLVVIRDASHSDTHLALMPLEPEAFDPPAKFWAPPHLQTTAYEVYLEVPIVAGRIYLRTKDGRIGCYDLRRA
jgi:hypothetical protein